MQLLLLPGNSPYNKDWIETVEKELSQYFEKTHIQYYDHWKNESGFIDIEKELEKLRKTVANLDDYVVFAKSIGVLLTKTALMQNILSPKKIIFVGTPLSRLQDLSTFNEIPLLFIQQTNDRVGSFKELKNILKEHNIQNYVLKKIPGDDHAYKDVDTLVSMVEDFLKKE